MRFYPFLLLIVFCIPAFGQQTDKQQAQLTALNNYVYFTNESIHGLLIVHRLLENFNQKINKYVDLESNQLNFYSNKDLPKNIFEDPEQWFYDVSPYAWYEMAFTESAKLPSPLAQELNKDLERLKSIITRVNAIRFELGHLTESSDLKERKNLDKIYAKLEECVTLYDDFNAIKEILKQQLNKGYHQLGLPETAEIKHIKTLHEQVRGFLSTLKKGEEHSLPNLSTNLKNSIVTARKVSSNKPANNAMFNKLENFYQLTQRALQDGDFPEEYRQYGKAYYYYNVEMISKTNRYGAGLIVDMNEYIKNTNALSLLMMEEPHFFKVIYPKRKVKVETVSAPLSKELPSTIKDRQVIIRQNPLLLNTPTFLLEISDHQLEDGDIVSINYNDRWILKEYTLKRKPLKIQLRLRPKQSNYLLLHAENIGSKPPNTAKISYVYNGERRVVLLASDTEESEMIELKLDNVK